MIRYNTIHKINDTWGSYEEKGKTPQWVNLKTGEHYDQKNKETFDEFIKRLEETNNMTEQEFFYQAEKEVEELNRRRAEFMADETPVEVTDIPKLLKIGKMLRNEDTSLNAYELYKHPVARAKLFTQITEACYMVIDQTPSQSEKLNFGQYLEGQFQAIVKKLISQTDTQALGELVAVLDLDDKLESQFILDIAVSGLLAE